MIENTGFFEESPGIKSSMRLLMFIWGVYAVILTTFVWFQTLDYIATLAVFTSISGVAVIGKVSQKSQDVKQNNNEQV